MKTIEEIRVENLETLIQEAGGVTRFADAVGKSQSQISQMLHGSPDSKTGTPKGIGSRQAREFEEKMGKERGWMDNDHSDKQVEVFKQLPPEVRSWLMKAGAQADEPAAPPPPPKKLRR